jgi:hypothetical protein
LVKPQSPGLCNDVNNNVCGKHSGSYPSFEDVEQLYDLELGLANGRLLEQTNLIDSTDPEAVEAKERLKAYLACHSTRPVMPRCTLDALGFPNEPAVELPACPCGEPAMVTIGGGGPICDTSPGPWWGDNDGNCGDVIGCDGVLGSGLVHDACGVCGGDGSSCGK